MIIGHLCLTCRKIYVIRKFTPRLLTDPAKARIVKASGANTPCVLVSQVKQETMNDGSSSSTSEHKPPLRCGVNVSR